MNLSAHFSNITRESVAALREVEAHLPQVEAAANVMCDALLAGHKVLTCGNGGSAAQAQHLAEELVGRYQLPRRSLPAVSLVADGTLLTCIVNDYGADEVFARQVDGLGSHGDALIAFSTSGNSANVLRALQRAQTRGVKSVALLGRDGGACRGVADVEIIIATGVTARVQEAHLLVLHLLCEAADLAFPPEED